ncbi:PLDc N-terminal domain-containing protein [Jonesia quinghaiensis]|uniref:PLDc N-terminal domain-containing protein n=1 Tax=Jonesia quinghaiensis TaxID=262806 RepID=UPI0004116F06|nr:PLDc N-terminal domain-containing protein [Jonesia quinghaiensis]
MLRVLLFLAIFLSALYCLIDLINADEHKRGHAPKFLWAVVIILLPLLGPLIWVVFTSGRSTATSSPAGYSPPPSRRGRSGPVAPDDDPEFLWRLKSQQQRNTPRNGKKPSDSSQKNSDTGSSASSPDTGHNKKPKPDAEPGGDDNTTPPDGQDSGGGSSDSGGSSD